MQQILIYSDSLSWGIIPNTRERLDFDARWPGIMENELNKQNRKFRVIENCLNGRRTVWEDPFKAGRNGLHGLAQCIEMNSPLTLVILMLGSNDFQSMHQLNVWHSAQGIAALIACIRRAPVEPAMTIPEVLLVVPPLIEEPKGPIAAKFAGADQKCTGLVEAYREKAEELNCLFFDSNTVTGPSRIDGIHLDVDQHRNLGLALAKRVQEIMDS